VAKARPKRGGTKRRRKAPAKPKATAEETKPAAEPTAEPVEDRQKVDAAQSAAEAPDFDPDADPLAKFSPDDFRPGAAALAVGHEQDVHRVLSVHDELQILDEIQGRALDVMVYSYPADDGGMTTGLSYKGTAEVVRTLNVRGFTRIRVSPTVPPKFEKVLDEKGQEAWQCTVYAENEFHGGGNYGTFVQPVLVTLDNGETVPSPFVRTIALSKAQRNAYEPLLPIELVEALKAQYIGQGRVKRIPHTTPAPSEVTPALTDDRAKEQIARCEAIYDELKGINRAAMVPGQFNRLIVQAQHDHDALDRTIGTLEDFRDTEREIDGLRTKLRQKLGAEAFEEAMAPVDSLRSQTARLEAIRQLVDENNAAT
jgi:hypothetical protein